MQASTSAPDITFLFQDLLSPPATVTPSAILKLITYHLTTSPPTLVPRLAHYISASPSLWRGQAIALDESLDWERASDVYTSLRDAVVYRSGETTKELGSGWRARRRYAGFLEAYLAGVNEEELCHPVIRLLMASAALAGLQIIKARKDKLYVGGSALMGRAEKAVVAAWEAFFAREATSGSCKGVKKAPHDYFPSWLAGQTFPTLTLDVLKTGPLPELLHYLTDSFSLAFQHGSLFASLASDIANTGAGFHWSQPSPSHSALQSTTTSPLFSSLGPISRALGRTIEASPPELLQGVGDRCEHLTILIQRDWASTPWSDVLNDSELDEATRNLPPLPWTALKSLLFSLTLVQSSLLLVLTPVHATTPAPLQVTLAAQALRTLGNTYFITMKFGSDGFGAWKGVWAGFMEVVRHDDEAVANLMSKLAPANLGKLHVRVVERSLATYYLNAAEQLMKSLTDKYTEETVLLCCRPYLEDPKYRETFEAAHSVVLAVFSSGKTSGNSLALWYTELLLKAYPDLMTTSQLRLAFTTMVRCVSTSDDAVAWYCIGRLIQAIEAIPLGPPGGAPLDASFPSPAESAVALSREFDDADASTRLDEAHSLSPLETEALTLKRGHLLLTLIDQTTSVNLVLLTKLLDKIWEFVRVERGTGKDALIQVVFTTLGEGLDSTKREAGVAYWLQRSQELADEP